AAAQWWGVLRYEFTADESAAILKRLRQFFGGKLTAKELDQAIRQAEKYAATMKPGTESALWQAGAEVSAAAGNKELEQKYLERATEQATDSTPLLRLADLHAGKKAWKDAALRYQQAWELDKTQPLPLFLRGQALLQLGQEAEGRKLMETAH